MSAHMDNGICMGGGANDFMPNVFFHPDASNNCDGGNDHNDVSPVVLPA